MADMAVTQISYGGQFGRVGFERLHKSRRQVTQETFLDAVSKINKVAASRGLPIEVTDEVGGHEGMVRISIPVSSKSLGFTNGEELVKAVAGRLHTRNVTKDHISDHFDYVRTHV